MFDAGGWYMGPLPHDCGHVHKKSTIGKSKKGGFNTSPTAAYPPEMCRFIATRIFRHWIRHLTKRPPFGGGVDSKVADAGDHTEGEADQHIRFELGLECPTHRARGQIGQVDLQGRN